MKIAWIYPRSERCGITFYSQRYISALQNHIDIAEIDSRDFYTNFQDASRRVNRCDAVHIQYETSLFTHPIHDVYYRMVQKLERPFLVTPHEIYRQFPGVFPRESITGNFLTKTLKRKIWDMTHPYQRRYSFHMSHSFWASRVHVHLEYQKEILGIHGVSPKVCVVIPHPVRSVQLKKREKRGSELRLVSLGFINRNFNYDLLFETLDTLPGRWRFTWIGGVRRDEDQSVLQQIQMRIKQRKWEEKFTITGWVEDALSVRLCAESHAFLALFLSRSNSNGISTAIACGTPVISTSLPMTEELRCNGAGIDVVGASGKEVAAAIEKSQKLLRSRIMKTRMAAYAQKNSFPSCAKALVREYEALRLL